jgi:hypothetical protein
MKVGIVKGGTLIELHVTILGEGLDFMLTYLLHSRTSIPANKGKSQ